MNSMKFEDNTISLKDFNIHEKTFAIYSQLTRLLYVEYNTLVINIYI